MSPARSARRLIVLTADGRVRNAASVAGPAEFNATIRPAEPDIHPPLGSKNRLDNFKLGGSIHNLYCKRSLKSGAWYAARLVGSRTIGHLAAHFVAACPGGADRGTERGAAQSGARVFHRHDTARSGWSGSSILFRPHRRAGGDHQRDFH